MIRLLPLLALAGCTFVSGPGMDGGGMHTPTVPSVMICLLSACDGQFSDRTERAGMETRSTTNVDATQEARSLPTVRLTP